MMPGFASLQRVARRIGTALLPCAVILAYHRIAAMDCDPWGLSVTPEHFAEHLEVVRQHGRSVKLRDLDEAVHDGIRIPEAIVVTFDDGYADNFYLARPILEQYETPATVFIASGYVGHEREFWWNELERVLLQPGLLPDSLCLSINGRRFHYDLRESTHYSDREYRRDFRWRAGHDAPTRRHVLYYRLWTLLGPLLENERRGILDDLLAWSGLPATCRPTHRPLSTAELLSLHRAALIDIGCHTVTHPLLSRLPQDLQRKEIHQSKRWLEDVLGSPVRSFAYPHGDYTMDTVTIVRRAGFSFACSTTPQCVRGGSARFQLPRLVVPDCNGEEFARNLSRWLRT